MCKIENIFLTVTHLAKSEMADGTAFTEILKQLKSDLAPFDNEGVPAAVTVVAETGLFSCEIAIGISCEHEELRLRLAKLANSYRGTFLFQDKCRA